MKKRRIHVGITTALAIILMCLTALFGCDALTNEVFSIAEHITDGENIFYTKEGRLFLTGGANIYEYTKEKGAQVIYNNPPAQNMGMAQIGHFLYVISLETKEKIGPNSDPAKYYNEGKVRAFLEYFTDLTLSKKLMRADLNQSPLVFETVHVFENMVMPNGMVASADGDLYVADLTYLPVGGIAKLTISEGNPPQVTEETWLTNTQNTLAANGMAISGRTIYFTDMNLVTLKSAVKKVEIINGKPGRVKTIYEGMTVFDDLDVCKSPSGDGVVATEFYKSRLLFVDKNGRASFALTQNNSLEHPSSVICSGAPLFSEDVMLVTEKGRVFDPDSDMGNALVGVRFK
jgi:hypothetical protein